MSILTTSYQIPPLTKKFDTQVTLPGSKSIALRQLAISALVDGKTILSGIPDCDDIDAMIECLGILGVRIQRNKNELEIVIDEANSVLDVKKVIASILLVEDLRMQKD